MTPKLCPVCGDDSIQPITRTALVKVEGNEATDVIAYRCGGGHVFLIAPPEEAAILQNQAEELRTRAAKLLKKSDVLISRAKAKMAKDARKAADRLRKAA